MRNPSRCFAKMAAALVIGGFTYGVALANPAHEIPAERRTAAGLLVLVGACLLPNALIVSAARDAA